MNSVDWSGTMFSAQARTGIPLVKTDVNRTMETLQEKAVEQNWGVGGGEQGGKGWEERQIKKKILTEVAVLSAQCRKIGLWIKLDCDLRLNPDDHARQNTCYLVLEKTTHIHFLKSAAN